MALGQMSETVLTASIADDLAFAVTPPERGRLGVAIFADHGADGDGDRPSGHVDRVVVGDPAPLPRLAGARCAVVGALIRVDPWGLLGAAVARVGRDGRVATSGCFWGGRLSAL